MCGIAGTLSFQNSNFQVKAEYLEKIRDTLVHRGPDGKGSWISSDRKVGLAHRRLAIVDLSPEATQPMSNHQESIWLTFNGEIYNANELRQELQLKGYHDWKTSHSDTEVIIKAYQAWGIDCVNKLRGIFAFALWDNDIKALWLVRDRLGVKPLYYSIHHGRCVFASEIKALLADPDQPRAVNEKGLFDYLSFLTTPAPDTLFAGIKKMPPATFLKINHRGEIQQHTYWTCLPQQTTKLHSIDEYAEGLLDQLNTSVNYRCQSDVPIGVFLSGGVDSSTNAILVEKHNHSVNTFSIGYDENYQSYANELTYAKQIAELTHANHHETLLGVDDFVEFLPMMIRQQDEPIADPVCMPVYYVSKLAIDNGVKVAQVGEGADELFCGYPGWKQKIAMQNQLQRTSKILPWKLFYSCLRQSPKLRYRSTLESLRRHLEDQPIFWGGAEAFTELSKRHLLHANLKNKFKDYSSWEVIEKYYKQFNDHQHPSGLLTWMSYLDLNLRLPELLLMRVDKMSMATGLEARVPFLDHKLVEYSLQIPESIRYKDNQLKYILKHSVKSIVPSNIIARKKQGFGLPIHEWFIKNLADSSYAKLKQFSQQTDYFNFSEVKRLFAMQRYQQIWYLLNFAMWHNEYIS